MKKSIYLSGIISTLLLLTGSILKLMHWPGAGVLLTVGMTALVLFFLPLALINNYKASGEQKHKILYYTVFLVVFLVYTGALFKIMHWPGAGIVMLLSILLPFFVFVPVFLFTVAKEKTFSVINTSVVLLFVAYMGISSAFLALNYSKSMLDEGTKLELQLSRASIELDRLNKLKSETCGLSRGNEKSQFKFLREEVKINTLKNAGYEEVTTASIYDPELIVLLRGTDNINAAANALSHSEQRSEMMKILQDNGYVQYSLQNTKGEADFTNSEAFMNRMFFATPAVFSMALLSDIERSLLLKEKLHLDKQIREKTP